MVSDQSVWWSVNWLTNQCAGLNHANGLLYSLLARFIAIDTILWLSSAQASHRDTCHTRNVVEFELIVVVSSNGWTLCNVINLIVVKCPFLYENRVCLLEGAAPAACPSRVHRMHLFRSATCGVNQTWSELEVKVCLVFLTCSTGISLMLYPGWPGPCDLCWS